MYEQETCIMCDEPTDQPFCSEECEALFYEDRYNLPYSTSTDLINPTHTIEHAEEV
jgi:hypothetical protein